MLRKILWSRWWEVAAAAALMLLLWTGLAFGQQNCRATAISGTRSSSAFSVWKDGERVSMHSTYGGAEAQMAAELEADSTAAIAIMQYMRGVWRRPPKRLCGGPETELPPWPPTWGECLSCPKPDTVFKTDTLYKTDTVTVHDTVPDPATEAALVECRADLGVCSADLAAALRTIDSLLALPPPPPDTVYLPCDCDTVPPPPVGSIQLLVSDSPDRSSPRPILGEVLAGEVYIFAVVAGRMADSVVFQIDARRMKQEALIPYDLAGGSDEAANPYDTNQLTNDRHSFAAIAWSGVDQWGMVASVEVNNPPPPPPPPGDVAWGIGSRPAHPPDGVWVQSISQTATRVDWGIGAPEPDMGYEITWPGGRIEQPVQTWIDLPEAIGPYDVVCVAPGPIGGPYDQTLRSCHSYWPAP